MEIQVSRALFSHHSNDENSSMAMNKKAFQFQQQVPSSESMSMTPVRLQAGEGPVGRGDLSTPRPSKQRHSPAADAEEGADEGATTPTEPSAPIKEKCKSDPRKKSIDLKASSNHSNKIFENPNAKALVFEDERTLAPLTKADRRAMQSAGSSRGRKKNSPLGLVVLSGSGSGESNMRTPKKGSMPMAWVHSEGDSNVSATATTATITTTFIIITWLSLLAFKSYRKPTRCICAALHCTVYICAHN
jgi:hypothetical protein